MDKLSSATAEIAASRVTDMALIGAALATAVGAVAFAGYMTLGDVREPLINGMEHLAIFAQPSHPKNGSPKLDMTPIGAVPHALKDNTGGYALVGAQPQFAWLREGNRIFAVRPGDEVPRLGRVAAIERRNERWALVDDSGATLLVSAVAELAASDGGRFSKRMIFGEKP